MSEHSARDSSLLSQTRNLAQTLAAIVVVVSAVFGALIYLTGVWDSYIEGLVSEVPTGAVVAFTTADCPAGWSPYDDAEGRFVVGVGRHTEHDPWGIPVADLTLGNVGGHRTHKLTEDEMPRHVHEFQSSDGYDSPESTDNTPHEFGQKNRHDPTRPTGGDTPHNNMPPYIALTHCRKDG